MSETEDRRPVSNWIKGAAFAVFVIVAFWSVAQPDDPEPASGEVGLAQSEAWQGCKDAVTAQLRNPDSADFSILSTSIEEADGGYDIDGSLTAQNDFGVEQSIAFSCTVSADGQVTAEVARAN